MKSLVVAAVLLALSCASDANNGKTVECQIDPVLSPLRREKIERAAAMWTAFANREVRIVDGGVFDVAPGRWLFIEGPVPTGYTAVVQSNWHLIRFEQHVPDGVFYSLALHEIGHVLGLEHVHFGVMSNEGWETEFSSEDYAECVKVGAC